MSDTLRKFRARIPLVGRVSRAREETVKAKARANSARKRSQDIARRMQEANASLAVMLARRSEELDVLRREAKLLRLERDGLQSELALLRAELDAS